MSYLEIGEQEQFQGPDANEDDSELNPKALQCSGTKALRAHAAKMFKPPKRLKDEEGFIGYAGIHIAFLPRTMRDGDKNDLIKFFEDFDIVWVMYSLPDKNKLSEAWIHFRSIEQAMNAWVKAEEKDLKFNNRHPDISPDQEYYNPYADPSNQVRPGSGNERRPTPEARSNNDTKSRGSSPDVFKIVVSNLHPSLTRATIERELSRFRSMPSKMSIFNDKEKNNGIQCAVLKYSTERAADDAMKDLKKTVIRGWQLHAKKM